MPFGGLAFGRRADGLYGFKAASALITILDNLDAAATNYIGDEGLLLKADTSANYTVTIGTNNEIPEMVLVNAQKHNVDTWHVTCDVFCYVDVEGNYHWGRPNQHRFYYGTGTIALGQEVIINTATATNYHWVDGANTSGVGKVIAKDDPSGYVQVFI